MSIANKLPGKTYIGDGLYAVFGSYVGELVVTSENGVEVLDRVVFGPEELGALLDYAKAVSDAYAEAMKEQGG